MKTINVKDETHAAVRQAVAIAGIHIGDFADDVLTAASDKVKKRAAKKAAKTPTKNKP